MSEKENKIEEQEFIEDVQVADENEATAENTQIKYQKQLIGDGNTGHFQCAYLTDHNVIQQGNKHGNSVLNNDGNGHAETTAVERFVTDVTLEHGGYLEKLQILLPVYREVRGNATFFLYQKGKHKEFLRRKRLTKVSKCNKIRYNTGCDFLRIR